MKRRQLRKALKLGAILVTGLLTAVLIVVFSIGPAFIEKRFNLTTNEPLESVSQEAQALHQSLTVVDLHADSLLWGRDLSKLSDYGHVDIPRLLQGNVALQVFTSVTKVPTPLLLEGNTSDSDNVIKLAILQRWPVRTWFSLTERAIYQAKQLQKLAKKAPDTFKVIETQQDLNDYLSQKQSEEQPLTAGLLGIEGAHAIEGKLDNIDRLYKEGFRIIGLSHFFDNQVAGSAHGVSQKGLTSFGKDAIQRMEELGMIVDLAHASPQTINDVLKITNRPVLVSHTGVQGTCKGARNLSDSQLQQVATNGGVVGIGFWKTATCGDDVSAIIKAIRYVVDKVGIDHVALGSDYDGAVRVPFDVAHLDQVTQGLRQDGFTDSNIKQIMGLNVINLLKQSLPA
ncbi:MAG: dipeptidase [Cyanobacteria bacterium J06623_4]